MSRNRTRNTFSFFYTTVALTFREIFSVLGFVGKDQSLELLQMSYERQCWQHWTPSNSPQWKIVFVGHQTTRDGTRWWWKGYGAGPGWKKVMDWWGLSTPKPPQWGTPPSQHIICIFTQPQFTENPWKCFLFVVVVYPLHLIGVFCFLPISIAHWEYLNIEHGQQWSFIIYKSPWLRTPLLLPTWPENCH